MCGIFGVILPVKVDVSEQDRAKYSRMFKQLMIANTRRGKDASGIFVVNSDRSISVYKRPVPAWVVMFDKKFDDLARFYGSEIAEDGSILPKTIAIIGHLREKSDTNYANDTDGAHPHEIGDLIGVHNGHISNWKELYPNEQFVSDSAALFRYLSDNGVSKCDKLVGAAAVCFINKNLPFMFNFFACGRPFSYVKEDDAFIFSSEADHLYSVLTRQSTVMPLKEGWHLKVNASKHHKISFQGIEKIKDKTTTTYSSASNYHGSAINPDERCDKCAQKMYSVIEIRSISNKPIRKICFTCSTGVVCAISGKTPTSSYQTGTTKPTPNIFYLMDDKNMIYYSRTQYLKWKNKVLSSADPKETKKCNSCKQIKPKNCTYAYWSNKTDLYKIEYICQDCRNEKIPRIPKTSIIEEIEKVYDLVCEDELIVTVQPEPEESKALVVYNEM